MQPPKQTLPMGERFSNLIPEALSHLLYPNNRQVDYAIRVIDYDPIRKYGRLHRSQA